MSSFIGLLLIVGGVILMTLGFSSTNSIQNDVSRAVSGHYTDRTTWYIIGGSVSCLVGLIGFARGQRA
jgi:hypothetical protein